MFYTIVLVFFVVSTAIMAGLGAYAAEKADQYKSRLEKIEKANWAVYSDLSANKTYKETLDNLMRSIHSTLHD